MNEKKEVCWETFIQSYRNSGMSLEKWCDQNHVSRSAMRYHLYAKKKNPVIPENSVPKLLEVNFDECLIQPSITIKLGKLEITVDHQNMDMVCQLLKLVIYD